MGEATESTQQPSKVFGLSSLRSQQEKNRQQKKPRLTHMCTNIPQNAKP